MPFIGETSMQAFQRRWPDLEEHVRTLHPELAQQDAIIAGSFAGLLTACHFHTDDPEANTHRMKTAAAIHQLSKRNLADEDIERIVTKVSQKIQIRKTQKDELVKVVQQLRDYLDYNDVLSKPETGAAA